MIQMRLAGIALVLATFGPVMIPADHDLAGTPFERAVSGPPACQSLDLVEIRDLAVADSAVLLAARGTFKQEEHSGVDWDVVIMLSVVVAAAAALVIIQP